MEAGYQRNRIQGRHERTRSVGQADESLANLTDEHQAT